MHDPFEMLFHGVFTEIEPVGDFFVGKAKHEVNDDHLLALGQVISLLDVGVGTLECLSEFFNDNEQPTVASEGCIRDTEPAEQQPLVGCEAEALDLDGFAVFWMIAVHEPADKFTYDRMYILWNQAVPVFSGRERLELPDVDLGFMVHEE